MNYYQTESFSPQSLEAKVSQVMKGVYVKMFLGLLVTAAVAWIVAATATPGSGFFYYMATHSWVYWGLALVELGLVMWISAGLRKMSSGMATGLFFLFAIVNGLTLSMIFVGLVRLLPFQDVPDYRRGVRRHERLRLFHHP